MDEYADLIITLSRLPDNSDAVELRYSEPGELVEQPPMRARAKFDIPALIAAGLDPKSYGELLHEALFEGAERAHVQTFFKECLAITSREGYALRVRLAIDQSAAELHNLRWETLVTFEEKFLAIDKNHFFSRFLYKSDWQRIGLQPLIREQLQALIVIANPTGLGANLKLQNGQLLAEVDVEGELERATDALDSLKKFDHLESDKNNPGRVTLDNLEKKLEEGCDILYLVCHGALRKFDKQDPKSPDHPFLWLEKDDGSIDVVKGQELVDVIAHLPEEKKPRLVVLASCQSAGQGAAAAPETSTDRGALAALGPLLVEAGVPAVMAMQQDVSMKTVERMMPVFFEELLKDGRIDRAMMEARWRARNNDDWWVPVLFLRLSGGQLWYRRGFEQELNLWPGIISTIEKDQCVPIIGSELLELLAGPSHQLAHDWAEEYDFPLERRNLEEIQLVAQFLSNLSGTEIPRGELLKQLRKRLIGLHNEQSDIDVSEKTLPELLKLIAAQHEQRPSVPCHILASLPFRIYVTANPDTLLEEALIAQNKKPQVLFSCWNRALVGKGIAAQAKLLPPTEKEPLVYHLFGYINELDSLVLTEDDYFDYLMWISNPNSQVTLPEELIRVWKENALLFLGFQPSDWNFRVLFRSILNEDRREHRRQGPKKFTSVAVQLRPGDENVRPTAARLYLENYFSENRFNVYWGSASDFLEELSTMWQIKDE